MDVEAPVGGFTILRTTDPIPFDATAEEFQQALEALSNVGPGNVLVTKNSVPVAGDVFTEWLIEFQGDLAGVNLPFGLAFVDLSGLITSGGLFAVVFQSNGVPGDDEVQTITPSPSATGGDFRLTFSGETTDPIPFNATRSVVQAALENLL